MLYLILNTWFGELPMKKLPITLLTILISVSACLSSYAGQWMQDSTGWWYQNDDGSYFNNGWNWIDGKRYYFTPEGYCLQDTQSPDGYSIDSSGAWSEGGYAMEMPDPQIYQAGSLTLTFPGNFRLQNQTDYQLIFQLPDLETSLGIYHFDLQTDTGSSMVQEDIAYMIDNAITEGFGTFQSKTAVSFCSGSWICYEFPASDSLSPRHSLRIYARLFGSEIQMVMFAGRLQSLNDTAIMDTMIQ